MTMNATSARQLLKDFNFRNLFTEELGWDRHNASLEVILSGQTWTLAAFAHKRGMVAYQCPTPQAASMPEYADRRKIEHQVAKNVHEHLIVFTDAARTTQIWQWVKREVGKPIACREHTFHISQTGDALLQKLQAIAFTLDEEEALSLTDVTSRARAGFDVERVTKRFYDQFQKEHVAFLEFVTGIPESGDHEWYASVMLNRLMFVYFMQRKGFLDDDRDYLRNRLIRCRTERGQDEFYSFYRYFLLRLFHEGLGGRKRSADLEKLVGKIPYLNGGIFDVHELERPERYGKSIQIPDEAFERIFNYFDQYQWHLDERPLRADNEINPDVLGYIFEKYINQKQMGAYYTKEDITGYISKNTVLPFLFDAARSKCKVAFENPGGPTLWDLLRETPDRYIYPAISHGVSIPLPQDIAAGLDSVSKRSLWNGAAPTEYALPTETWRELIARRKRWEELRGKLTAGEVRDTNDLITLNLDIRQFGQDVIENCEGPELLRAFWQSIESVTILDPTCGSGAFLFAALNILEPLYEACLDRMEAFVADLDRSGDKHRTDKFSDFRKVLERVAKHTNRRYFIFKSIILNNLFGVDIMEEAVEICKLRLFLKLAAQVEPDTTAHNLGIEPLPDIDFNIRAGNTLVGYTNYDETKKIVASKLDLDNAMEKIAKKASDLQQIFDIFRQSQTEGDGSVLTEHKLELRQRLKALEDELNRHLASEYAVNVSDKTTYTKWITSHQPFHWFVEFYAIMAGGGFEVIVGNPPYVEYSKIRTRYAVQPLYKTLPCGNLYTLVLERCYTLGRSGSWLGLIVPLSLVCTGRTAEVRALLSQFPTWLSAYDMRPGSLFEGVAQRLTIVVSQNRQNDLGRLFIGGYRRWLAEERPFLISKTAYFSMPVPQGATPVAKFSLPIEQTILAKIAGTPLAQWSNETSRPIVVHRIVRYFVKALDFVPLFFDAQGRRGKSEDYKEFRFNDADKQYIIALLNSTLFYWFWRCHSDGFHCGYNDVFSMPYRTIAEVECRVALNGFLSEFMQDLQERSEERTIRTKAGQIRYQEFYPAQSKLILDKIDRVLALHYGFTEEELDFIINYDIKYRIGAETEEEQ